ncbi:MAG TPA: dihydropteroate synthase [Acidimicrobiia bacterium]
MPTRWQVRDRVLTNEDHTILVGILNVTPDSFSDGGLYSDPEAAVRHGLSLVDDGADLVDVGGESTRPGSLPVGPEEELRRVVPVVRGLSREGLAVSVDTSRAGVAHACLEVGAMVVNDVTALSDPEMARVVAESGAGLVLMHMQGSPQTMQLSPSYVDVGSEVAEFLRERALEAESAGITHEAICIDPGIGFGKTDEHNLTLLRRLPELAALGYPVMVGASRKSFLGRILDQPEPSARDVGTAASVAIAIAGGAFAVRVHNVVVSRQAALVADAIVRATSEGV